MKSGKSQDLSPHKNLMARLHSHRAKTPKKAAIKSSNESYIRTYYMLSIY